MKKLGWIDAEKSKNNINNKKKLAEIVIINKSKLGAMMTEMC